MIGAAHVILFATDAEAARRFFSETLALDSVDAGDGWLIFALPPAELATHPTDGEVRHELYLMCDEIEATVAELRANGVEFAGEISEHNWGRLITMRVPGAGELGLYQPSHPSPLVG
jgi:catechol 2,3-dioxygenase-like lactoylglutathione lyase family enzyme